MLSFDNIASRLGRPRQPFGESEFDHIRLSQSPALEHLAAFVPHDRVTAGELAAGLYPAFDRPPTLPSVTPDILTSRPNPIRRLTIATYNVGLLGRSYLHTRLEMPDLSARRACFARQLLAKDIDIWLLQEVWEHTDLHRLRAEAQSHGYRIYSALGEARSAHGLAILVRESLVDDSDSVVIEGAFYRHQYPLEYRPGPRIKRAWISVQFTCQQVGARLAVFNTHLSPFPVFWRHRNAQARTFGLAIRRLPDDVIPLAGGDLNADLYYHSDTHVADGETRQTELWSCAIAHALLRHYGGLDDIAERGGLPRDLATIEVENPIHFRMYGRSVPNARLDHLLVGSHTQACVLDVSREFVSPSVHGEDGLVPLSDHYALCSQLDIGG